MNGATILVALLLAAACIMAVRSVCRQRRRGGCCGCSGNCSRCRAK